MNKCLVLLIVSIVFYSCINNPKNVVSKTKKTDDSLVDLKNIKDYPEITKLPLGSKNWSKKDLEELGFYSNSLRKSINLHKDSFNKFKDYLLPEIKKYEYIQLEQSLGENYLCNNGLPIDSIFKVYKYKYRLPNIGKYESYYMCNYHPTTKDYSEEFINNCTNFLFQQSGYLILYDQLTKKAIIINIYQVYYVDSLNYREYYIDQDYNIYITDEQFTDGDEKTFINKRRISILPNGKVKVEQLNKK